MVKTELANIRTLSVADIERMHALLIYAYAITEVEIWGENYVRMNLQEFVELIQKKEIILARLEEEIVGSIHVYPLSTESYAFGLLSADFNKKGRGIGRALINAAEKQAKEMGAKKMELEILKPQDFEVSVKVALHDWYSRLGYRFKEAKLFEDRKPDKAEKALKLKVPSVFDCYEKDLQ